MKLEQRSVGACFVLLFALAATVPSCSSTTEDDSQTHFFTACEADSECGGLECLCGRCTTRCGAGACPTGTTCAESGSQPAGSLCGTAPAPALCLPECSGPSSCPDGMVCTDGACTNAPQTLPNCTIDTLMAHVIGNPPGIVECGTLGLTRPESERIPAQQCAMSTAQEGTPFRVIWERQGTDSLLRNAVAGVVEGGSTRLYEFYYDSMGFEPNGATAGWRTCDSLDASGTCSAEQGLCITCEPDGVVHCECRLDAGPQGPGTIHCE